MKSDLKTNLDAETLSTRDAAEVLKVSVRAVQLWVAQGRLSAWRTPGGHRRIFKSSVEAMCSGQTSLAEMETFDILIVDNQALYSELTDLYACIPSSNIRVLSIENSLKSLIKMGETPPDLLITDVLMPHVNGVELLLMLSKHSWAETMKIIVISTLTKTQINEMGGLPSVVDYYKKPVVLADLVKTVTSHFETWKTRRSKS
ncbi:response regulator [Undibacterium sp. RuRC25W]|uniref:response regulator n=1 Tax=Undibacterium sp. RuRC25W TaxID=3413047 RepID=UPI003BEFE2AE